DAQKAVTRSTLAFSAAVNSAAASSVVEPNAAAIPATPAALTKDRRSNLLSKCVGIQRVPRLPPIALTAAVPEGTVISTVTHGVQPQAHGVDKRFVRQ